MGVFESVGSQTHTESVTLTSSVVGTYFFCVKVEESGGLFSPHSTITPNSLRISDAVRIIRKLSRRIGLSDY